MCRDILIQLDGGFFLPEDFLPLSLGTSDIILGIQWLGQFGTVTTNWRSLRGKMVTLVGDPTLVKSQISVKAMLRTIRKEKQGY